MKKLLLFFSIGLFSLNNYAYWPIVSIHRSDRGLFGYKTVNFQLMSLPDGSMGWVGNCSGAGLEKCNHSIGFTDLNDNAAIEKLTKDSEEQIALKIFQGSIDYLVQLPNEAFLRRYTVVWNTDNRGDGDIEIYRIDVN